VSEEEEEEEEKERIFHVSVMDLSKLIPVTF
jgi:hypothetical protein